MVGSVNTRFVGRGASSGRCSVNPDPTARVKISTHRRTVLRDRRAAAVGFVLASDRRAPRPAPAHVGRARKHTDAGHAIGMRRVSSSAYGPPAEYPTTAHRLPSPSTELQRIAVHAAESAGTTRLRRRAPVPGPVDPDHAHAEFREDVVGRGQVEPARRPTVEVEDRHTGCRPEVCIRQNAAVGKHELGIPHGGNVLRHRRSATLVHVIRPLEPSDVDACAGSLARSRSGSASRRPTRRTSRVSDDSPVSSRPTTTPSEVSSRSNCTRRRRPRSP